MTAIVNGEQWTAGAGEGASPPDAYWYGGDSTLFLVGTDARRGESWTIGILANPVFAPGQNALGDSTTHRSATVLHTSGTLGQPGFSMTAYFTNAQYTGTLTITDFDASVQTVKGTFTFQAKSPTGPSVAVDQGSFSLHYQENPGKGFP